MVPDYINESSPAPRSTSVSTGPSGSGTTAERTVTTTELLGGAHRVWIEHATERYLLQVTRSGKLILTK
jgi:hemin uptake protein HemP